MFCGNFESQVMYPKCQQCVKIWVFSFILAGILIKRQKNTVVPYSHPCPNVLFLPSRHNFRDIELNFITSKPLISHISENSSLKNKTFLCLTFL